MHIYSGQYQRRGAKSESQIAKKENSYNPVLTRASVVLQCNCSARFRSLRGVSMRLSNLGMPKSGVAESQAESYATPSRWKVWLVTVSRASIFFCSGPVDKEQVSGSLHESSNPWVSGKSNRSSEACDIQREELRPLSRSMTPFNNPSGCPRGIVVWIIINKVTKSGREKRES